jgi:enoyl-CoA hydratase/carnithine racemase
VVVADDDGVRTVTLDRPARLNAFTAASYRALAAALVTAAQDEAIRVVELVGAGRAFSSGVDLDALAGTADPEEYPDSFAGLLAALIAFPKPLVAGVHGPAVGFGATILLHADVVLVADDARLRLPFTALGTAPEAGSSVLLPLLVGPQRAAEWILTSRWIDADEAVRSGLAARRCTGADLRSELRLVARQIAAQPPEAVAAARRLLRSGRAELVRAALGREDDAARELRVQLGTLSRPRAADGGEGGDR